MCTDGRAITILAAMTAGVLLAATPSRPPAYLTPPPLPGDWDTDNDVDLADFAAFQRCLTGEGAMADPACRTFDARTGDDWPDGDVDLVDYTAFARRFTGAINGWNVPASAADLNQDWSVDLEDYAFFQRCFSGADIPAELHCLVADRHGAPPDESDGDVDIADFIVFVGFFESDHGDQWRR